MMDIYFIRAETDNYPDLLPFIINCIKGMSKNVMKKSLSISSGLIRYEAMFSKEFYRVSSSLLPVNVTVSPEITSYLNIKRSAPDCYINDNKRGGLLNS